MKKTISLWILLLMAGIAIGQSLEKGNLVGQHVGTIALSAGTTYEQYKSFLLNKYIPEMNKTFKGELTVYLMEGDRGNEKTSVSYVYVFKNVNARNKYFPGEEPTEEFNTIMGKLKSLGDQLDKMGTYKEKFYTDWIVQ
jgi:hypothetical protein